MGTVLPRSESLRQAVRWISDRLNESEKADRNSILQDAVFRFNLSPKDTEFIYAMYRRQGTE